MITNETDAPNQNSRQIVVNGTDILKKTLFIFGLTYYVTSHNFFFFFFNTQFLVLQYVF